MGVHDHHISANFDDMRRVFERYGYDGLIDSYKFLPTSHYRSTFNWEKYPTLALCNYLRARLQENVPLSPDEVCLYEFVKAYCQYTDINPIPIVSDIPGSDIPVLGPARVKQVAARLSDIDLSKALEWYDCVWDHGERWHQGNWTKDEMLDYLGRVIAFWREAASNNEAVYHVEY